MIKNLNLLCFCLALCLTGCGSTSDLSDDEIDRNLRNGLTNKIWKLESYGFETVAKTDVIENDRSSFTVQFFDPENDEPGKFSGYEYCNLMHGSYDTEEGTITIYGVITTRTKVECPAPEVNEDLPEGAFQQEVTIVRDAFRAAMQFEVDGEELILTASDSTQLFFTLQEDSLL